MKEVARISAHPKYVQLQERLGGGGEPPDNGDMQARIAKLESFVGETNTRLHGIEKELAVLRAETKTNIADAKNSIIMWVVSAILLAQLLPALLKQLGP